MVVNYERHQLELIAAEYLSRGYTVVLEENFRDYRADAIARRRGETVVIEVVNASAKLSARAARDRVSRLRRLVAEMPDLIVDLRYVDNPNQEQVRRAAQASATSESSGDGRHQLLSATLRPTRGRMRTSDFMWDWSVFAQTLRRCEAGHGQDVHSLDALWERFLERLSGRQQLEQDSPLLNYPKIKALAAVALEGGAVTVEDRQQLRALLAAQRKAYEKSDD